MNETKYLAAEIIVSANENHRHSTFVCSTQQQERKKKSFYMKLEQKNELN